MQKDVIWVLYPAKNFAEVSRTWQALCDVSARSPLLSSDFVAVALKHFGRGDELVCIAKTARGVVAATILRRNNLVSWQAFQPSQMPLGPWIQVEGMDPQTLMQSLLHALPGYALTLGLTQLDPQFSPRPGAALMLTMDSYTTGEIDLPDSRELFKTSLNSKPFSRRMRKAEKEIGPITLTCETNPDAVAAFVLQYASMESRGWKGLTGTALQANDAQSNFYVDLLRRFTERGQARMFTLKMGDRTVAAQMAIAANGTLLLLKTTYEPELKSLGPGVILHYYISLDGFHQQERVERIEFYGPINESQKMWLTGNRTIYHVNTYRSAILLKAHRHLISRRSITGQEKLTS